MLWGFIEDSGSVIMLYDLRIVMYYKYNKNNEICIIYDNSTILGILPF